ncbi:WRKY Transcription Factor [Dionaea muscipula]
MENQGYSSVERTCLIRELTQGMDMAKQLKAQLSPEFSGETKGILVEQILSTFDKALLILNWSRPTEQPQQVMVPSPIAPAPPISNTESPQSEDLSVGAVGYNGLQDASRDFSKKRKTATTRTKQVKVNLVTGLEGPPDDGYSWRKYGQKDILGAAYPSYYRCTYRGTQDCWARKQVQRSDEDPSMFDITYKGQHTCRMGVPRSKSVPTSPAKHASELHQLHSADFQNEFNMMNFQAAQNLDMQNMDNHFASTGFGLMNSDGHTFSTTLDNYDSFAPFTYFSVSPCNMEEFGGFQHGHHSESDITDIISATTSGTNSPIVELDFTLDPLHLNPSFPFDNSRFLP